MATYVDHVGDIFVAVSAYQFNDNQVEECTLHFQCAVAGGGDTRVALLTHLNSLIVTNVIPNLSSSASLYGSKLSTVKALGPWSPVVVYNRTAGSDAYPPLPTQVRGLISWHTALAGRAYRGRMYLPTPGGDQITSTSGVPTGVLTDWGTLATGLVAPYSTGGTTWIPGVYHRVPTAVISSIFDQITSATVSDVYATQRRSGAYGRPNVAPF